MAYATVSELEDRWRTLSPLERQRAQVMLEDAAALIDGEPRATDNKDILRMVSNSLQIFSDHDQVKNLFTFVSLFFFDERYHLFADLIKILVYSIIFKHYFSCKLKVLLNISCHAVTHHLTCCYRHLV